MKSVSFSWKPVRIPESVVGEWLFVFLRAGCPHAGLLLGVVSVDRTGHSANNRSTDPSKGEIHEEEQE